MRRFRAPTGLGRIKPPAAILDEQAIAGFAALAWRASDGFERRLHHGPAYATLYAMPV